MNVKRAAWSMLSTHSRHVLQFASPSSAMHTIVAQSDKAVLQGKIDMMLQSVLLSGLRDTFWAKPMEPQSVISPAKPSYVPSKPKPMSWDGSECLWVICES